MGNKPILNFIRTICKPGKLLHYKLNNNVDNSFKDKLTAVLAFIAAAFVTVKCYPYDGVIDFIIVIASSFILAGVCVFAVSFCYSYLVKGISALFYLPALIYDLCDDKINNVARKKTTSTSMKSGPRAEVGIKYFIEREKRIQINHAKYIGND